MPWRLLLVLLTVGAAGCASPSSQAVARLTEAKSAGPQPPQPATIEDAIGGRKFTGYVSVSYGDGDRGQAPCATATLELDGEPRNFWVASYWSAAPEMALSAKLSREAIRMGSGFVPGTAGAATSSIVNSPLLDAVTDGILRMYGDLFEIIGASTPETCEALRPREGERRLGDGRCRPARLDIY